MRHKKYIVWLLNIRDSRDDEWLSIRAADVDSARVLAKDKIDYSRFNLGYVYHIKEARKIWGQKFPF